MKPALLARLPLDSLHRFVDWWGSELSELIRTRSAAPQPWRIMFLRRARGCGAYIRDGDNIDLIATPETGSDQLKAELTRRQANRKATGPIVLRLLPTEVVATSLTVPSAAREIMVPVLRNQIERLAPWPIDKALFA